MQALRVTLESNSAAFRWANVACITQPSYPVPPPSVILGLLSAAMGQDLAPTCTRFAYTFEGTPFRDYASMYKAFSGGGTHPMTDLQSRPYEVDCLGGCKLTLYLVNLALEPALRRPVYPLRLGRSEDLATVTDMQVVSLRWGAGALVSTIMEEEDARRLGGWASLHRMACHADEQRNFVRKTYALYRMAHMNDLWYDPSIEVGDDLPLAVHWLSF